MQPTDSPPLTPRQRFDRWLEQRALDLNLRSSPLELDPSEVESGEWPTFEQEPVGPLAAWSPLPTEAGEVRLLDASLTPLTHDPIFVVVVEIDVEAGMATLVSVSPYLDAATPFETNLQHTQRYLHALQVWNLRRLPLTVLNKSWRVASLHPDDLAVAQVVATASIEGITPPESVLPFCGSPIRHPQDPRRAYLEEQADILDHLQSIGAAEYFAEEDAAQETANEMPLIEHPRESELQRVLPEVSLSSPSRAGLWNRVAQLFSRPAQVTEDELILSAATAALPDIIGTLGDDDRFDYIISCGKDGCALAKLMSSLPQNEPVKVSIGDQVISLSFEWEDNFSFASAQTTVPFRSDLKLTSA